jgi:hypothetical protein
MSDAKTDTICVDNFGENVVSFRTLLKRFMNSDRLFAVSTPVVAQHGLLTATLPIHSVQGLTYTSTSAGTQDLFNYLRFAFLGLRGSIRKRIRLFVGAGINEHSYVNVNLEPPSITSTTSLSLVATSTGDLWSGNNPKFTGSITIDRDSNGGIEAEFPFYSNNHFLFSFASDYTGSNPGGRQEYNTLWYRNYSVTANTFNTTNTGNYGIATAQAVGEDFNFIRFQGAPPFVDL